MTNRDKIARGFGAMLANDPGPGAQEERLVAQRAAFSELVVSRGRRPVRVVSPRIFATAFAAAAAALCLVGYAMFGRGYDEIPFYLGDSNEPLHEGYFVRTASDKAEIVRFYGGHHFEFGEKTAARIVQSGDGAVIVDMTQGNVAASVVPDSGAAWIVRAGPYKVAVKGTVFSVSWNEADGVLGVTVDRGKVAVFGPGMDTEGVYLSAGKSLSADAENGRVTFGQREASTDAVLTSEVSGDTGASHSADEVIPNDTEPSVSEETDHSAVVFSEMRRSLSSDWRELYVEKDFQGILDLAEKKGIYTLKRRLGREDLWIVANAARYARNGALSDDLFATFRKRFPGFAQSQTAAFLLAKSASEQRRPLAAKEWFETYLREAPAGPLAEEALGRLIQVYARLGESDRARRAAKDYLARYEGGYFTKQARLAMDD